MCSRDVFMSYCVQLYGVFFLLLCAWAWEFNVFVCIVCDCLCAVLLCVFCSWCLFVCVLCLRVLRVVYGVMLYVLCLLLCLFEWVFCYHVCVMRVWLIVCCRMDRVGVAAHLRVRG